MARCWPMGSSVLAGGRRGSAARTALWAAAILSTLTAASWGTATPAGKAKDAVIPLPGPGVLYVRYGTPGGVRITSVTRPARADTITPAAATISPERAKRLAQIMREELDLILFPTSILAVRRPADLLGATEERKAPPGATVIVDRGVSAATIQPRTGAVPEEQATVEAGAGPTQATTVSADSGLAAASEAPAAPKPDLSELGAEEAAAEMQETGVLRTTRMGFAFDRADVLPESEASLQTLAEVLRRNPDWHVRVEGYADKRGDDCYNLRLSIRRAQVIRRLLIDRYGIAEDRLQAVGFGEQLPVLDEDTDEAYAANRRVEFRLVE